MHFVISISCTYITIKCSSTRSNWSLKRHPLPFVKTAVMIYSLTHLYTQDNAMDNYDHPLSSRHWGPFYKGFLSSQSKYRNILCCFQCKHSHQIRSHVCTCLMHNWAVVTYAHLWPDWIIRVVIKAKSIFFTGFQLQDHKLIVIWSQTLGNSQLPPGNIREVI